MEINRLLIREIKNKNYQGTNFSKYDFKISIDNSNFSNCEFDGNSIIRSKFKDCLLTSIRLRKVNAEACIFEHSNAQNANFEWANFERAKFTNSNLDKANFQCARLNESTFRESRLTKTDFRFSHIANAIFDNCNLISANFCDTDLKNTKFINCNLKGAFYNMNTVLPFSPDVAQIKGMIYVPVKSLLH